MLRTTVGGSVVLLGLAAAPPDPPEVLEGHKAAVTHLAFSPDGSVLLSAGTDGQVLGVDLKTRKQTHRSFHRGVEMYAVAWAADGKRLAAAGADGAVRVWEPGGEKPVAEFRGHDGPVCAVAFAPDGRHLASGGYDRTIRIWPAGGGEGKVLRGSAGRVTALAFTPDGKALVSGGAAMTELRLNGEMYNRYGHADPVRVWDVGTGKVARTLAVSGTSVALGGGRVLAAGIVPLLRETKDKDGGRTQVTSGVEVLAAADLDTGKEVAALDARGTAVACSADGSVVAAGGLGHRHVGGNIMLGGNRKAGGAVSTGLDVGDKVTTLLIDPGQREPNNIFVMPESDPRLTVRDASLNELARFEQTDVEALAVSSDGKTVAVGGGNGTVRLYRVPGP